MLFSHSGCWHGKRWFCYSYTFLLIYWLTYLAHIATVPIATPAFANILIQLLTPGPGVLFTVTCMRKDAILYHKVPTSSKLETATDQIPLNLTGSHLSLLPLITCPSPLLDFLPCWVQVTTPSTKEVTSTDCLNSSHNGVWSNLWNKSLIGVSPNGLLLWLNLDW